MLFQQLSKGTLESEIYLDLKQETQNQWKSQVHREFISRVLYRESIEGNMKKLLSSDKVSGHCKKICNQCISTVQFSPSVVSNSLHPMIAAIQASLSITSSWSLLRLMPIESVMPSSHLILCHPLLFLPPIPPSISGFPNESTLRMRWPKYWSFSFSISPFNEHPGLISFRMDWLDLLAVQGTLKSLLQHHSSKASIFWHSAFFTVQFSHPYMTTGKTITLTRQTFVGKVISLLFNMLSRLVITFLSRSKRLLISWLQSPSAVILESVYSHMENSYGKADSTKEQISHLWWIEQK